MSKRLWALGLAMTLVASAQPGFGIVMHEGAKNDPAWQEEYKALGAQYSSVVAFYGFDGSNWWNIGSGTVISPHHVIGAAHVALDDNGQKFVRYGMVTGNHLINDWWGMYQTTTVEINPLFTGIGSTDLAIWTFLDEITADSRVTPANLYAGDDSALIGSLANLAGFGQNGYPSTGANPYLDGAKRGCEGVIAQLGYPAYGAGSDQFIMSFGAPGSPDYRRLGGSSAGGDSGGGWFVPHAPLPTIFAVNGYHIGDYSSYPFTGGTSVSQHIDWIYAVSGVPEPATAMLLGLGVIFLRRRRG